MTRGLLPSPSPSPKPSLAYLPQGPNDDELQIHLLPGIHGGASEPAGKQKSPTCCSASPLAVGTEAGLYVLLLGVQVTALGRGPGWVHRWMTQPPSHSLFLTSPGGFSEAGRAVTPQDRCISHLSALPALISEAAWSARKAGGDWTEA